MLITREWVDGNDGLAVKYVIYIVRIVALKFNKILPTVFVIRSHT